MINQVSDDHILNTEVSLTGSHSSCQTCRRGQNNHTVNSMVGYIRQGLSAVDGLKLNVFQSRPKPPPKHWFAVWRGGQLLKGIGTFKEFKPITLSLKRISRERNPASSAPFVNYLPVNRKALQIERFKGLKQDLPLALFLPEG